MIKSFSEAREYLSVEICWQAQTQNKNDKELDKETFILTIKLSVKNMVSRILLY